MTSQHRIQRFRVAPPTLEPDPVFLDMLAHVSASSRAAAPRTARTAGLRMIAATASMAVIAGATWAAGAHTGVETPLSPAGRSGSTETTVAPSPGDVGTPHPDVVTLPGSPKSPGLPGTTSRDSERAAGAKGSRPARSGRGLAVADDKRQAAPSDRRRDDRGTPQRRGGYGPPAWMELAPGQGPRSGQGADSARDRGRTTPPRADARKTKAERRMAKADRRAASKRNSSRPNR